MFPSGKSVLLMLRAQALKAARLRAKAASKAAKAAAEAAANSGSPDVIVTNTQHLNDANVCANPEVDTISCAHQRAITAVATLIQVPTFTGSLGSYLTFYSDLFNVSGVGCNYVIMWQMFPCPPPRRSPAQCGSSSSLLTLWKTPRPRI